VIKFQSNGSVGLLAGFFLSAAFRYLPLMLFQLALELLLQGLFD